MTCSIARTAASQVGSTVVAFPGDRPAPQNRISVVVPCYNEAARLDTTAFEAFLATTPGVRVVFVNDGSSDDTLDLLSALHGSHPESVTVLSLSRNSGKAEAVRQGLLHACENGAELIGYWDADLATPLSAVEDFARIAARFAAVDVVFGARRQMLGHRIERTMRRRVISRLCASLARLAALLPIGDTQCGAKLLRNTAELRAAIAEPFSAGWLFDVELFSRLSACIENPRRAFYEFPLAEWTEVPGSKVTGRAVFRAGVSMLRIIAENRLGLSLGRAEPRAAAAIVVHSDVRNDMLRAA